jgi:UPF0271 protein
VTRGRFTVEPFGDAAWRVRLAEGMSGRGLLTALRAHPGVLDAVVTEQHALVTFDPAAPPRGIEATIEAAIAESPGDAAIDVRDHRVSVRYDGEDLAAVAAAVGRTPREIAALHAGRPYVVAAIGFLPGFAYLRGLDPALVVPRRGSPRPRVAAGSVAVAGPYTGVYPFASPGGWNLLGRAVDFEPFDRVRGAHLSLGDRVTFVEVP